ncbi:MAG: RtcB family protein [Paramuribaculum sp.]|nr:RtcB family protein [Paramuribaculum sp.]
MKHEISIPGHDLKIFTTNIEQSAINQIQRLLDIDVFADKKIRIMPDVHAGAGCVIGFTGDLGDKVIPNIVGVDIGCGMSVVRLGKIDNIDFHAFNNHILTHVPSGHWIREEKKGFKQLTGEEMEIYREAKELVGQLHCYRNLLHTQRIHKSIGSLGGGNHFIELNRDDEGWVYLVIHTGSRNLGKQVADHYQKLAIQHLTPGADSFEQEITDLIERYKAEGRRSEIQATIKQMRKARAEALPSLAADLCYLEGEGREMYLHDMRLCQRWAVLNRRLIAMLLLKFFNNVEPMEEFESVHNYISDSNLVRKGAISAAEGERCIIPLNMRDGSLICTGLGNPDWNCSAPHGAGRVLSRAEAFHSISMKEFEDSMLGIYSESVSERTLDESPMAYKPADEIIANIGPTVSINTIIRPIFNFKAS